LDVCVKKFDIVDVYKLNYSLGICVDTNINSNITLIQTKQ